MPGDWGLGAPAETVRRQRSAGRTFGILLGVLVVVVVLVWVVGVVYSNPYSRGTACRETDSDVDCVKPKPGPGYYRPDQPATTNS